MRYGPWPRSGRLLRHFSFSSSFLRCPNPGGAGHVQGALAHRARSEEHTSELQSQSNLVCRLLLEKKKRKKLRSEPQVHGSREGAGTGHALDPLATAALPGKCRHLCAAETQPVIPSTHHTIRCACA